MTSPENRSWRMSPCLLPSQRARASSGQTQRLAALLLFIAETCTPALLLTVYRLIDGVELPNVGASANAVVY